MYLLIREISPYRGPNMLLGVFASDHDAAAARVACIQRLRDLGDPLAQQPYREVDLESDLRLQLLGDLSARPGETVFVVSELLSAQGQDVRTTCTCFLDLVSAVKRFDEINAKDDGPREAELQSFVVGELRDPRAVDAPLWPELCVGEFRGIEFEIMVQLVVPRMSRWGRIEPSELSVEIDLAHGLPDHLGGPVRVFFDAAGRVLGVFGLEAGRCRDDC